MKKFLFLVILSLTLGSAGTLVIDNCHLTIDNVSPNL